MASNAVVSGPTAKRVAANVERIRKARQLHQKDLSARLAEVGRPMLSTVISKIERGERRVDVDDLVALALALNVSPSALLLPPTSDNTAVQLTDTFSIASGTAWDWSEGHRTAMDWEPGEGVNLAGPGADPAIQYEAYERSQEFQRRQEGYEALTRPEGRRRTADHPAIRLVRNLLDLVTDLVAPVPDVDRDVQGARARMARRRHAQLGIELEEISEQLDDEAK